MIIYENERYAFHLTPDEGELFIEHSKSGRGGHLGHAMTEYDADKIICFYPNCDGVKGNGHTGHGWMEYKKSQDGGKTWDEAEVFPYSKNLYDMDFGVTAMCEKAITAKNGNIIVFNLLCDIAESQGKAWGPHPLATYCISKDEGKTWSKGKRIGEYCGRIYDVIEKDDKIYVLMLHGKSGYATDTEFHLYESCDYGETFTDVSHIPFRISESEHRYYGTLGILNNNNMICYTYCEEDEFNCTYMISKDAGRTWEEGKAYFDLGLRNVQLLKIAGAFFMFGRSRMDVGDFVAYASDDGMHWSKGTVLKKRENGAGAYSNTLLLGKYACADRNVALIQASHAYDKDKTNVYHWFLTAKEK